MAEKTDKISRKSFGNQECEKQKLLNHSFTKKNPFISFRRMTNAVLGLEEGEGKTKTNGDDCQGSMSTQRVQTSKDKDQKRFFESMTTKFHK